MSRPSWLPILTASRCSRGPTREGVDCRDA